MTITTKELFNAVASTAYIGYLAINENLNGPLPAVLVAPEW